MSMTGNTFDWRAFWADLLSGAGRSLLELDGSREAQAALSGLDFFEAARRRAAQAAEAPEDGHAARRETRAATAAEESDESHGEQADAAKQFDPSVHDRRMVAALGLAPSVRPAPLSADPYDHAGLPVRLRLGQRGIIRRG